MLFECRPPDRSAEREVGAPDLVRVQRSASGGWLKASQSGVSVTTEPVGLGLRVDVAADQRGGGAVSRIQLRWRRDLPAGVLVLGDAWERSYGDLQWRGLHGERVLPWMVLVHDRADGLTWGLGVEVRAGAFAGWTVDAGRRIAVARPAERRWSGRARRSHLDRRRGPPGGERRRPVRRAGAARRRPVLRSRCRPVRWSAATTGTTRTGADFDAAAVVRDARLIAELVGDHPSGRSASSTTAGPPTGPRTAALVRRPVGRGPVVAFPDMAAVAADIAARGGAAGHLVPAAARPNPADGRGTAAVGRRRTPSTRATQRRWRPLPPTYAGCGSGASS